MYDLTTLTIARKDHFGAWALCKGLIYKRSPGTFLGFLLTSAKWLWELWNSHHGTSCRITTLKKSSYTSGIRNSLKCHFGTSNPALKGLVECWAGDKANVSWVGTMIIIRYMLGTHLLALTLYSRSTSKDNSQGFAGSR